MSFYKALICLVITTSGSLTLAAEIPTEMMIRPTGTQPYRGNYDELVTHGEQLWNDKNLSRRGKNSCASCHKSNTRRFKKTFLEPYPHQVKSLSNKSGLSSINAEQIVQFMMVAQMKNEALPWESKELAALTSYVVEVVQKQYFERRKK